MFDALDFVAMSRLSTLLGIPFLHSCMICLRIDKLYWQRLYGYTSRVVELFEPSRHFPSSKQFDNLYPASDHGVSSRRQSQEVLVGLNSAKTFVAVT